jgi:hypothetical protein
VFLSNFEEWKINLNVKTFCANSPHNAFNAQNSINEINYAILWELKNLFFLFITVSIKEIKTIIETQEAMTFIGMLNNLYIALWVYSTGAISFLPNLQSISKVSKCDSTLFFRLQSIPFIVNGSVQKNVFVKAGYSL